MIYTYKKGSNSAKAIAEAMGMKQIKLEGSKFKGSPDKLVINWGSSSVSEEVQKCKVMNKPKAVAIAANKLKFFQQVEGLVTIPDFTTDPEVAKSWSEAGSIVVGRKKLNGHSGEGLYIIEVGDWDKYGGVKFPLYTKYVPKKDEFRVHVVGKKVIDVRRKALKAGYAKEHVNWKVRNLAEGFIFAKEGFETPQDVLDQSIAAVLACGLDFGAVDVVWNNFRKEAYVLEINTACGLEGSTVDNYASAFKEFLQDEQWQDKQMAAQQEMLDLVNNKHKLKFKKPEAALVNPEWVLDAFAADEPEF